LALVLPLVLPPALCHRTLASMHIDASACKRTGSQQMLRRASAPTSLCIAMGLGSPYTEDGPMAKFCAEDPAIGQKSLGKGAPWEPLGLRPQVACAKPLARQRRRSPSKRGSPSRRRRASAPDLSPSKLRAAASTIRRHLLPAGTLGFEFEGPMQNSLGSLKLPSKCCAQPEVEVRDVWHGGQQLVQPLRIAIANARDAGHRVRSISMQLLRQSAEETAHTHEDENEPSSSVLGLSESGALRIAIKRTLRTGLGDEYKDLLASAVRTLEKLQMQRALLSGLSDRRGWDNEKISEVVDKALKNGIQSAEFDMAQEFLAKVRPSTPQVDFLAPPTAESLMLQEALMGRVNKKQAVDENTKPPLKAGSFLRQTLKSENEALGDSTISIKWLPMKRHQSTGDLKKKPGIAAIPTLWARPRTQVALHVSENWESFGGVWF